MAIRSFPRGYKKEDTSKRHEYIKKFKGVDLANLANPSSSEKLKGIIENHIGYMEVPMGIASPLVIAEGTYATGEYVVPLCTVEGTLVASMNRGMFATSLSGGIKTEHFKQEISRAPFFILNSIKESNDFIKWIEREFANIKREAESTTRYGKLIRINQYPLEKYVILDFLYTTGNAAGQNMVSLATMKACEYIKQKTQKKYILDSNFASDKKASSINLLRGRGHYVVAECTLDEKIVSRVLGINDKNKDMFSEMIHFGPYASSFAGNQGIQLHLANALTAIYLATGQDAACVAENSVGYTMFKHDENGLKVLLTMPSLTVGTVGGGTSLSKQRKNLELLGCAEGENSSKKFSEIICAAALCLEISLFSAIISEDWVSAHMKYGR